jgi:hypothetical protein
MGAVHSIEGLIKWVRRDEWRAAFEDVFQRHVGHACRGAGIELDKLAEIVGDHGVSNLWGCAFENFVTPDCSTSGKLPEPVEVRHGGR